MNDKEKTYNGYKPDDAVPLPPSNRLPPDAAMLRAMEEDKTLRDEIAIAALQGMLAGLFSTPYEQAPFDGCAADAYKYADAMLAQRGMK